MHTFVQRTEVLCLANDNSISMDCSPEDPIVRNSNLHVLSISYANVSMSEDSDDELWVITRNGNRVGFCKVAMWGLYICTFALQKIPYRDI